MPKTLETSFLFLFVLKIYSHKIYIYITWLLYETGEDNWHKFNKEELVENFNHTWSNILVDINYVEIYKLSILIYEVILNEGGSAHYSNYWKIYKVLRKNVSEISLCQKWAINLKKLIINQCKPGDEQYLHKLMLHHILEQKFQHASLCIIHLRSPLF